MRQSEGGAPNAASSFAVARRNVNDNAPEPCPSTTREGRAGHRTRYREYVCPVTGLRVDEIVKEGEEALHDIEIDVGG